MLWDSLFLSTPSGWRATVAGDSILRVISISIHALRVEGDLVKISDFLYEHLISIHALRVEGDPPLSRIVLCSWVISIHALRVEGDFQGGRP